MLITFEHSGMKFIVESNLLNININDEKALGLWLAEQTYITIYDQDGKPVYVCK